MRRNPCAAHSLFRSGECDTCHCLPAGQKEPLHHFVQLLESGSANLWCNSVRKVRSVDLRRGGESLSFIFEPLEQFCVSAHFTTCVRQSTDITLRSSGTDANTGNCR